jgi:RNA polymerase sigma-70 factor (ECF subfamily)
MKEDDSLNSIVGRLIRDDKKALDEIYHIFYPRLYVFSKSFLKVDDDINDILQDVFVKIWMHRHNIKNVETFNAYIFTTTKNAIVSYFREKIKFQNFENRVKNHVIMEFTSSADAVEYADMKEKADYIIEQLPEKRKAIFKLRREEGLSYKEIAEKLEISVKTAEDHMMHINRFLRKHLKDIDLLTLLYCSLFL